MKSEISVILRFWNKGYRYYFLSDDVLCRFDLCGIDPFYLSNFFHTPKWFLLVMCTKLGGNFSRRWYSIVLLLSYRSVLRSCALGTRAGNSRTMNDTIFGYAVELTRKCKFYCKCYTALLSQKNVSQGFFKNEITGPNDCFVSLISLY